MSRADVPVTCPKCGQGHNVMGPPFQTPTWHRELTSVDIIVDGIERQCPSSEHLCWSCRACGYTVQTPTADASVGTPL